jgi:hypothetical protein
MHTFLPPTPPYARARAHTHTHTHQHPSPPSQVPADAHTIDLVFLDSADTHGGFYDSNNGLDYHISVRGAAAAPQPLRVVHVAVEMAPIAKVCAGSWCVCGGGGGGIEQRAKKEPKNVNGNRKVKRNIQCGIVIADDDRACASSFASFLPLSSNLTVLVSSVAGSASARVAAARVPSPRSLTITYPCSCRPAGWATW